MQLTAESLVLDDVHVTQQIGKQALDAGFQAILAPCATHKGKNVVILLGVAPGPLVKSSQLVSIIG